MEYFLSPFTTIVKTESGYVVSSLMDSYKKVCLKSISDISPKNRELIGLAFFENTPQRLKEYKEQSWKGLERLYNKQPAAIGYIETTKRCPYNCQICPKSWQKQHRLNSDMSVRNFDTIMRQLKNQKSVALHLFGDPLLDREIFTKIKIANEHGIQPSFSTNLISLLSIDIYKFIGLKLRQLIISFDAYDSKELSIIRGKTSKEQVEKAIFIFHKLDKLALQYKFVDYIDIQQISLKINSKDNDFLKALAQESKVGRYVTKKYINFPFAESMIGTKEVIQENEKVLLYRVIGQGLPMKCLKPWIKKETGITTDGEIVPCCLSLNSTVDLGNAVTTSINKIFDSEHYKEFREEIFENDISSSNIVCKNCRAYSFGVKIDNVSAGKFEFLKKYTISDWRYL